MRSSSAGGSSKGESSYTIGGVQVQVPMWDRATCALERGGRYSIFARAGTTPPQKWQWIVCTGTSHESRARVGRDNTIHFCTGFEQYRNGNPSIYTDLNAQRPGERISSGRCVFS